MRMRYEGSDCRTQTVTFIVFRPQIVLVVLYVFNSKFCLLNRIGCLVKVVYLATGKMHVTQYNQPHGLSATKPMEV